MRHKVFQISVFLLFVIATFGWSFPYLNQNLASVRFNQVFALDDAVQSFDFSPRFDQRLPTHLRLIVESLQSDENRIDPASAEPFLQRCQGLFAEQKLEMAITWCKKSAALDPQNASPLLLLGRIYFLEGDWEQEIHSYEQAIQIDPANSWAYYYLGNGLEKNKNYEGALNTYKAALSSKLDDSIGYSNFYHRMGLNYHYLYNGNEGKQTLEFLNKAIELNDYRGSEETQESTLNHRLAIFGQ